MLKLIRNGAAVTRAQIVQETGLARSTVTQRVDALVAAGLIYEAGDSTSTGGRRPTRLAFRHDAGIVLTADLGATHSRVGLHDLAGEAQGEAAFEADIADGPERILGLVHERFGALLIDAGHGAGRVRGIGIGVPGPVAFGTGQPVNPPIMPGWDGFDMPAWFAERYPGAPVLVDNDVNIMALGEHAVHWREAAHLLYVKVGTGIGCGIVAGGRIHRGEVGAAGDIGHIVVTDDRGVVCRCGNTGCLEAVAGGRAIARELAVERTRDVVRLVQEGNADAIQRVRAAGRALGEVLAACVNFFNPRVIVIGGDLGDVHEHLLAGVREIVFQRSLPLATRDLRIVPSRLGDRAGVTGAASMVIEHILAPAAVDQALRDAV